MHGWVRLGVVVALVAGCEPDGEGSCEAQHGVELVHDVLSSSRIVEGTDRPIGEVLTELSAGLTGELQLGDTEEPATLAELRFDFASNGKIRRFEGDCVEDERLEVEAAVALETDAGESLVWQPRPFWYNGQVAVEWLGGPMHAVLGDAYWPLAGAEPRDVFGCMSIGGHLEPSASLGVAVGLCEDGFEGLQMYEVVLGGSFTPR